MSKIVYDRATATAAAALWEVFLENRLTWTPLLIAAHLEVHGANASRDLMVDLAPIAEEAWRALSQDEQDELEWDWGFIPMVLATVNWTLLTVTTDPSARGLRADRWELPTVAEILATVRKPEVPAD